MSVPETHHLFWTADEDPRNCIVIGYTYNSASNNGRDKPIYYHFQTGPNGTETVTKVLTGDGAVVAQLDWSAHDQLGMATIQRREQFMSYMVMKGKTPLIRIFEFNRRLFEWRRREQLDAYDLYTNDTQLATFRRDVRNTPVGRAHAVMEYVFDDDPLLLEALIALGLNRWLASKETRGH